MHSVLSTVNRMISGKKLSILIYHQVLEKFDPMRPNEPTKKQFDWQMALLNRYFTPISLTDAAMHIREDTLPANAACITFDDGYLNTLTVAQPILQKYNIPATVYVSTAFCHGLNMWNDNILALFRDATVKTLNIDGVNLTLGCWDTRQKHAEQLLQKIKTLPVEARVAKVSQYYKDNPVYPPSSLMMTPEQIKMLSDKGVEIGAHTVNHPILQNLDVKNQSWEIHQSKRDLESWTGKTIRHFAYPNGIYMRDFDDTTVDLVKNAGFETATVTDWGTSNAQSNPFLLRRFTPWDQTPLKFHARLVKSRFGDLSRHQK